MEESVLEKIARDIEDILSTSCTLDEKAQLLDEYVFACLSDNKGPEIIASLASGLLLYHKMYKMTERQIEILEAMHLKES